jgi:hypothetical protein
VRVTALPKGINDHTPQLIDTGNNQTFGKKKFIFEKWWLERIDFRDVVVNAWGTTYSSSDPMEIWQTKIRALRKMVRGWANNVVAKLNRHKNEVAIEYNWLDVESKHRQLHDQEKEKMRSPGSWNRFGT